MATLARKQKTDLSRSVSLLTPQCPSDHIQALVQHLPLTLSVSSIWLLLHLVHPVSRPERSNSLS